MVLSSSFFLVLPSMMAALFMFLHIGLYAALAWLPRVTEKMHENNSA